MTATFANNRTETRRLLANNKRRASGYVRGRHLSQVSREERDEISRQFRLSFKTMHYLAKTHNVGTSAIRAICLQDA